MNEYKTNLNWTGERVVPDKMSKGSNEREIKNKEGIYQKHLERYKFAEPYTRNKTVLDAACGTGYGLELFKEAKARTGLDISGATVEYCKERYPDVTFHVANLELPMVTDRFDIITSFETIEHLENPHNFLDFIKRSTREKFIFSIPINNKGKYHKVIYSAGDIKNLISKYFNNVMYFGQGDVENNNFRPKFIIGVAQ